MVARFKTLVCCFFLACAVFPFQQAYAQLNSSVQGTISDASGAVIPGTKVTLHNTQTGVDAATETNPSGYYRFLYVAIGEYEVTAEKAGFTKKSVSATVTADQTIGINITLTPATTKTTVLVTAAAPALNPEETRTQATLQASQVEALPLQNGSVLEVLRVAPGVVGIDEDRVNWAINIGGANPTASANGMQADSNLYMLDGAPIQSSSHLGGVYTDPWVFITPNSDMVSEVSLETVTFGVENGSGSSMKVNFATKSGTNDWHGDVQYRYGSKGLTAVTPFTATNSPFVRKWWLTSFGGPIRKDKTFFFFSYEHQTQLTALSSEVTDVTPQFTQWAAQTYPNSLDVTKLMVPFPPDTVSVTNPAVLTAGQAAASGAGGVSMTGSSCSFLTTTPQPIPCSLPLEEAGNFPQSPFVNGYQLSARLDQYFNGGKDRLYGNYMYVPQNSQFLWWHSGYNALTPTWTRYANLNYTHSFSSTLLNQASITWQRYRSAFTAGKSETIPFLTLIFGSPFSPGLSYFGTPGPTVDKEHDYTLRDDLTWVRGNHSFKFGFQGTHNDFWFDNSGYLARPSVVLFFGWPQFFDDSPFQYGLSTLSGKTGQYIPQINGAQANNFALYAQDDWRVTSHLKLTLGLRWDEYGNPSAYGHDALPFAQVVLPSASALPEQFAGAAVKTVSNAFAGASTNNVLPRAGFAWSPLGHEKWSIRGGVGLYEDSFWLSDIAGSLGSQRPDDLSLTFSTFNPLPPTNVVSAANLYGTTPGTPPYGYTYPTVKPLGYDSRGGVIQAYAANGTPILYPANLNGADSHLGPKRNALFTLGFERELGRGMVAGATYSGSRSWDLWYSADFNTFPGDLIVNKGTEERLTSEWGSINYLRNGLSANYNALILVLRRQTGRLNWQASYTWSRNLDYEGIMDAYNPKANYGPSSMNAPQRLSFTATYLTPNFGSEGLTRFIGQNLLGGWQLGAIGVAQSGTPFTVYTDAAWNPSATSPSSGGDFLANGVNLSYPDIMPGTKTKGFTHGQYEAGIFGYNNFTLPSGYGVQPVYGNEGRNIFSNPAYCAIDTSLRKRITLPWFADKKSTLIFGVEATNFFNHANFQGVNADMNNDAFFGQVNSAYQGRIVQLVGRFEF
jgi:outer membrane receptor protein involved in Fe transport